MELTYEYGLMHFQFKNNVGYNSGVMAPWSCNVS
jgi:hypothetical protein